MHHLCGSFWTTTRIPYPTAKEQTALQLAAQHQHAEVVNLLVSTGIRPELVREAIPINRLLMTPEVREAFGETAREPEAIAAALKAGDAASLNKLIRSGAYAYWTTDPILRVNHLRQAIEQGRPEIARILSASEERNESLKASLGTAVNCVPGAAVGRLLQNK